MQHLDCGKHQRALENDMLFDKAALRYAEQLEGQAMPVPAVSMGAGSTQPQNMVLKLSGSQTNRFTLAQKLYLTTTFKLKEQTGKRDPAAVAQSVCQGLQRHKLFTSKDYLTTNQIAGFFPHLASKKRLAKDEQQVDPVRGCP